MLKFKGVFSEKLKMEQISLTQPTQELKEGNFTLKMTEQYDEVAKTHSLKHFEPKQTLVDRMDSPSTPTIARKVNSI